MNLRQCIDNDIKIVENVDVLQRFEFASYNDDIDQETDLTQAMNICETEELPRTYRDDLVTYDVFYQDKTLLWDGIYSELEDLIARLVIKSKFKSIKVAQVKVNNYLGR